MTQIPDPPAARPVSTDGAPALQPTGSAVAHAACGILGAAAAVAAGHLAAGLSDPQNSPVLAVGSTVIDATPTPVKEWAVATLGTADKPVLIGGVLIILVVAAALLGYVGRRHPGWAVGGIAALGVVGALAALIRPLAGPFSLIPGLAAGVVGVATYAGLRTLLLTSASSASATAAIPGASPEMPMARPTGLARRGFLLGSAGVAALAAAGASAGQYLADSARSLIDVVLPQAVRRPKDVPAGLETRIEGITPLRTPNAEFYRVDTALVVPRVDADSWSLTIDGEVDRSVTISFADLLKMPMIEKDVTLTCVSNEVGGEYAGGARWLGVPVREVLALAGVRSGVEQILSTDVQGMTISTPIQALTDDREALLAVGMNGAPLPREHGFPVRLVTPGLYGYVGSTKWVTKLTATSYAGQRAYWTVRGWSEQGPILTQSRIDVPRALATVRTGASSYVAGVAWAQQRGIRSVEVSVDDGPWQRAQLGPDAGIDYWVQWFVPWTPSAGQHRITVRATDKTGQVQTTDVATPFPRGATGLHTILVTSA